MGISADDFLKQAQKKKSSKLEPYLDDILKLRAAKLSYEKICEFLRLNGIETTAANLSWFVRSRDKAETAKQDKVQKVPSRQNDKTTHKSDPADNQSSYKPPSWAVQKSLDDLI